MIGNGHAGFGRAASEKDPQGHLAGVVPRQAAIPARLRGMDPGTGSRSDARMASALRRCAVLVRLVAHDARTPARRRGAQTTTSRRMARAVHCDRSVRELGGGGRGRLRRRLSVRASMPLTYERGLALDRLCTGALKVAGERSCDFRSPSVVHGRTGFCVNAAGRLLIDGSVANAAEPRTSGFGRTRECGVAVPDCCFAQSGGGALRR